MLEPHGKSNGVNLSVSIGIEHYFAATMPLSVASQFTESVKNVIPSYDKI